MFRTSRSCMPPVFLAIFLLLTSTGFAQKKSNDKMPQGKPVLWEQVDVAGQNIILGPAARNYART